MKNKYIKEFPRAIIVGLSVFVVIIFIEYLNGTVIKLDNNLWVTFLYTMLYSCSLHLANTFLFTQFDRIFINDRFAKKRIIIGFLASFFTSMTVIFVIRFLICVIIEGRTINHFFENESIRDYILPIVFTFIITLVIHLIYLYKWYQESKVKEQKIIAGTASAQFESLKNQIDPHFLFNSLNVLSSLIEEHPENAQRFTTSLSKIYRYVLEQKDKELVPVSEELAFAKTYMNLLKMRFENSLFYELPSELPDADAKVVPLSLQLLLENTVKHNVVSEQKPLHIRIKIIDNNLVIENDLQKKEVLGDRKGVGLQNIINRYAILTHRKVQIEETNNQFSVSLPILTKQISVMEHTQTISEDRYLKAQKKVEDLKGFYGNLATYIVVNAGLLILNLLTSPQNLWFFYPLLGWGIGVAIHAMSVFNYMPFLSQNWEDKKIQELMNKEKLNQWK